MSAMAAGRTISIIVPTLNEEPIIGAALARLAPLRGCGHEVILSDGGSEDATVAAARGYVDKLVIGPPGRGRQMKAGAQEARGEVLLFLHADTVLPGGAERHILTGLESRGYRWGRFDVSLSHAGWRLRLVGWLMNWRSRVSAIATGDQAIFVERSLYAEVGGFRELPLMEDIELCARLRARARPLCLQQRVVTSSRRWERDGVWRTVIRMWRLRLAFALGVDAARLHRSYDPPSARRSDPRIL